jgi:hypothetical protein
VAAGVVFAQMPDGDHHGDNADAMHMGQMTSPAMMQGHMKDILGEDGYRRMLDVMVEHGSAMPMAMSDMDGMMPAMGNCLGRDSETMPGSPGAGQHEEHHPTPVS